jgi:hypothetical protein
VNGPGDRKRLPSRGADGRVWIIAWGLTLVLHAGLVFVFQRLGPLQAAPAKTREPKPIQLVFTKPAPEPRSSDEPHMFSELPADRADKAPEKADFLSNVTSRARDHLPGGDTQLPRLEGQVDAPLVRLDRSASPSQPSPASEPAPRPSEPAGDRGVESEQRDGSRADEPGNEAGRSVLQRPGAAQLPQPPRNESPPGTLGNSESDQVEGSNPGGNASLQGDVSLSTTAWNYAPWLQRFGQLLRERWHPPTAYSYGILKEGGWAVIEVEISRSGKMLRMNLLEEQGHPSLIRAAQSALRSMAPIEPLPADFPEPTLILRIRMIYPRFQPR